MKSGCRAMTGSPAFFDYVIGYMNLKQSSPTFLPTWVNGTFPSATAGPPFQDLFLLFSIPLERFRQAKGGILLR